MGVELSPAQQRRAASLMLGAVQARFPNVDEGAHALLLKQAGRWIVARQWEAEQVMIVLTEPVSASWGPPEPHLHILTDGSSDAAAWVEQRVDEIGRTLGPSASCRVSAMRPELLAPIRRLGFGVSKLGLGGDVPTMLKHIARMRLVDPEHLGLRLETVSTIEHIRASSALRRDYFLSHPEHGWASGTMTEDDQRAIDERVQREFERRLEEQIGSDFVLLHDEDVIASFGFNRPQPSPIVGCSAGFNICIAPHWHGRGLGKLAYAVMVRRAAELGVEYMHGSTSNAGVIHIASKLGRKLDNWLLRLDPPWLSEDLAMMPALLPAATE